jgi:hypothetical protein
MKKHAAAPPPAGESAAIAPAVADKEADGVKVSRDTNGNAVITMSKKTQGDLGILVKSPSAFEMNPELKGYGRVLGSAGGAAERAGLGSGRLYGDQC